MQIIHATLHKALKQAVKWQLVPRNAAESVDLHRANKTQIRSLSEHQVRKLLGTVEGGKLAVLYVLAISTSMRSGELPGLKWEDVGF